MNENSFPLEKSAVGLASSTNQKGKSALWLILLILAYMVPALVGLNRFPLPTHDESMYSALGCAMVNAPEMGFDLYGDSWKFMARPRVCG